MIYILISDKHNLTHDKHRFQHNTSKWYYS